MSWALRLIGGRNLELNAASVTLAESLSASLQTAARLAPDRRMQRALVLGVVGLALRIAGAAAMWGAGPARCSLAISASAMLCARAGGRLRGMLLPR